MDLEKFIKHLISLFKFLYLKKAACHTSSCKKAYMYFMCLQEVTSCINLILINFTNAYSSLKMLFSFLHCSFILLLLLLLKY